MRLIDRSEAIGGDSGELFVCEIKIHGEGALKKLKWAGTFQMEVGLRLREGLHKVAKFGAGRIHIIWLERP